MGSDWQPCVLGDLLHIKHGWAFKGTAMEEGLDDGPIVVAIGNFEYTGGFRFGSTKIKRYTGEFPSDYILSAGDILLAMTCQTAGGEILGIPGKIPDDENIYLHNQRLGKVVLRDQSKVTLDYLYWLFLSRPFNQHLYLSATGTKILHTSPTKIEAYEFLLPSLQEQKAIAHILGSLDDKIELNRQMNATLEAIAQALFKSWFVDFDPVIDNALAAGNPIPQPFQARAAARQALGPDRKPLPAAIQTQFPNSFTFNDNLGWIPEGWSPSTVGEEFNVTMGQSPPGHTYNENGEGIPFFQGCTDYGFRYPSNRVYCTDPKRLASKNDTLVSVRAPVGDVNMAAQDCCIGRGVA
ncbi:MAG: restriction endonuclease subunit S, partial [Prochlorothrix sp.]